MSVPALPFEALQHEWRRIARTVPRFLEPLIRPDWDVLSIGCGYGADVVELRRRGYRAWGLDPSRLVLEGVPAECREYVRVGRSEDLPFGERKFDFAYALDVIEHVGCIEFGTRVMADTRAVRLEFLRGCVAALKPGGVLIITTSNKLCPIDPGHWHGYHWLGRRLPGRRKFGLSIPWSRQNFLVSVNDVRKLLAEAVGERACAMELLETAEYPNLSARRGVLALLGRVILRLADWKPLRGSPVAPILVVKITLRA